MKRFLIVLLILICANFMQEVCAFNIVYPKKDNVIINSDKTFFIGNENPLLKLKINDNIVNIHPSGGFKHVVNLNYGENKFVISNGKEVKIFKIIRPLKSKTDLQEKKFISYAEPLFIQTSNDKSPLRSTPVDSGLNRLQHLQKGINMQAIGEYGDFYKVKLSRDDNAWINKSNTVKNSNKCLCCAMLENSDYKQTNDAEIFKFKLTDKVPYVLSEDGLSGYNLVFYNMCDSLYPFGRFEFPIAHDGKNFGYSSYYNDDNELVVKIRKYHNSLKGLKITLDAGHGGSELGAIGCLGDKEKDINLQIALKLKDRLQKAGADVYLTRGNDRDLGLYDRVDYANKNDSQIFISIHNNALPDSMADKDASGTEVYYFYPQARYLAKVLSLELSKQIGFKNRGAKGGSFAVIRNSDAVAVLIEIGFMINPEENSKLRNSEFQNKIIDGIIKGLEKYFNGIDMEIVRGK